MDVQIRSGLDWDDVRVFLAVARTGSLSAAARALRVNHTTISRRLAKLEEDLDGGRLLERSPDGYRLTEAGADALADAERMEAAADSFRLKAQAGEDLTGLVRVSAVASFGERLLAGPLARLALAHPGLTIELAGEDRNVSVERGDADLAVRFGRPEHGDALTRRLGEASHRLYAAPAYLAGRSPADWSFIGFTEAVEMRAPMARDIARLVGDRPTVLRCTTLGAQREAAAAGGGVALLPDWLAADDPRLVPAPDEGAERWSRPIWLVLRPDIARVARARLVADAIVGLLAA
ncbi:MAG: LysR family transcriptional regulator [Phenylobacterium zucineum]|nr:MAG: LysR family transcriptional regulator [Phenylobacterium zucineum]